MNRTGYIELANKLEALSKEVRDLADDPKNYPPIPPWNGRDYWILEGDITVGVPDIILRYKPTTKDYEFADDLIDVKWMGQPKPPEIAEEAQECGNCDAMLMPDEVAEHKCGE